MRCGRKYLKKGDFRPNVELVQRREGAARRGGRKAR
jgi:hypothetical protein